MEWQRDPQEQTAKHERDNDRFWVGFGLAWGAFLLFLLGAGRFLGVGANLVTLFVLFLLGQLLAYPLAPLVRAGARFFQDGRDQRERDKMLDEDDPTIKML
jgi:hypothetical protein